MIHSISAKNFQSLFHEVTLDLTTNRKASERNEGYATGVDGTRVILIQALIGGNASGKTTMLKALAFIKWLQVDSFRWNPERNLPIKGFAGSKAGVKSPTEFTVTFELSEDLYEYAVSVTKTRIISESLHITSLTSVRRTSKRVFLRSWNKQTKTYDISDSYFKLKEPYWVSDELRTTSVIAAAAKFGNEKATAFTRYWRNIKTNMDIVDRYMPYQYQAYRALERYNDNKQLKEDAEADIRKYDLGIASFGKDGSILHKSGDTTFELELEEESSGTQQLLALKARVDHVLKNGGVALIDELNAYLHPLMVEAVIEKFKNPKINIGKGQFLFSTHDINVFNLLDPYQMSLAEKDAQGATSIKRLDGEKIRSTDSYMKRYLAGYYGGLNKIEP